MNMLEEVRVKGNELLKVTTNELGTKRNNICFLNCLVDNAGNKTINGIKVKRIVGYEFISCDDIVVIRVPFEDKNDIYKFDENKFQYETIKANTPFYLKPAEMMLLIIKDEYNGKFTGGKVPVTLCVRCTKENRLSYSLRTDGEIREHSKCIMDAEGRLLDDFIDWEPLYKSKTKKTNDFGNTECIAAYFRSIYGGN